ncbi:hypothetical protein [Rhodococcus sp. HNM0569]|uniref:hypothetical protein n=1 Tax=Rhodococcus sp. HNM0569 TaxID=2716340 RepID=UPI00146F58A4|nr:hypothetical protein [Rhodococcus sp. HNM0569]NLU82641.1 hypothetical protein [Rhodococcus sp. HNM0569]
MIATGVAVAMVVAALLSRAARLLSGSLLTAAGGVLVIAFVRTEASLLAQGTAIIAAALLVAVGAERATRSISA